MSPAAQQIKEMVRPYNSSAESVELFPDSIERAFDRIEEMSSGADSNKIRPSAETVEWAKRVLLRVLPRHYLRGAEIDAFEREIHVNWEHGTKRVTVFLPSPNQLKVYCEQIEGQRINHWLVTNANDNPWALSGELRWLFD